MNFDRVKARFLPMSETMFYILLSLIDERHGYGIMQHVRNMTEGRIALGAGTVYQSLGKLESEKLIACVSEEDRRKIYRITTWGRQLLTEEARRIAELYRNSEALR